MTAKLQNGAFQREPGTKYPTDRDVLAPRALVTLVMGSVPLSVASTLLSWSTSVVTQVGTVWTLAELLLELEDLSHLVHTSPLHRAEGASPFQFTALSL